MTSKTNRFIPLRNYTQYSLSKGALRINELIDFCKKENVPAAAITDFNNLFGSLEFCIECKKLGILTQNRCTYLKVIQTFRMGLIWDFSHHESASFSMPEKRALKQKKMNSQIHKHSKEFFAQVIDLL